MKKDNELRTELVNMLTQPQAHITFKTAVEGFPENLIAKRIDRLEHTAWMLLYHLWICQWDILEFSRNQNHKSPSYPEGLWPESDGPASMDLWYEKTGQFQKDQQEMIDLIMDESNDLYKPFPHGSGQNLVREAMVLADHNSYHIGQLVDIRMLLGCKVRDW